MGGRRDAVNGRKSKDNGKRKAGGDENGKKQRGVKEEEGRIEEKMERKVEVSKKQGGEKRSLKGCEES